MAAFEIKKFVPASPELGQTTSKHDKVDSSELARDVQHRFLHIKTRSLDSLFRVLGYSLNLNVENSNPWQAEAGRHGDADQEGELETKRIRRGGLHGGRGGPELRRKGVGLSYFLSCSLVG